MNAVHGEMTVSAAARRAGITIDTIRYYERRGLLAKAPRNRAGYRSFDGAAVQRLRFIRHAQVLGFTLKEIMQLLALRVAPGTTCNDVRSRAQMKMSDIERKIRALRAMKMALQELLSACTADGPATECSFLTNLDSEEWR